MGSYDEEEQRDDTDIGENSDDYDHPGSDHPEGDVTFEFGGKSPGELLEQLPDEDDTGEENYQ